MARNEGLLQSRCKLALACIVCRSTASNVMKTLASWAPAPNLTVTAIESGDPDWIVSVDSRAAEQDRDRASCPVCGIQSSSRHSSYIRTLRDLSAQGRRVNIQARLTRWRCRNDQCDRRIFAERLPTLATPFARRTARLAGIVRLFGHSVGGRPSERLMARLGMPVSDTTILRSVKECAGTQPPRGVVRVAGIDEWAWRKGMTFGTVIVDLERRQVVELLADRSAGTAADWFKRHPEIEVVSRDRAGLYADAARQGAPQARQVADRFHLLKNFQETVERQLGRFEAPIRASAVQVEDDPDTREQPVIERSNGCSDVAAHERLLRRGRDAARKAMFDESALRSWQSCYRDCSKAGSWSPAGLSMGASHRPAGAQRHGAESLHAGLFRSFRNVSTTHMGIHASRGSYWGHIGISPLFSVSEV